MKTMFVSVDFSVATRPVIEAAVELALKTGARMILHHSFTAAIVTSEYGLSLELMQETADLGEKAAHHQLEHLEDELTARGLTVESILTQGGAAWHILSEAAKRRADLIVLGSHGHTALYNLLIGSTTHDVLKQAECPVLVVPRSKTTTSISKTKRKPKAKVVRQNPAR